MFRQKKEHEVNNKHQVRKEIVHSQVKIGKWLYVSHNELKEIVK